MLVDLGGGVHLSLPSTQLNDSLLRFLKNLYLREQLMVDLRYCLTRILRCHDGWRLVLARGLPWLAVRPTVVVSRSPS